MIEYYDLLNEEEQDDMRDLIQLLLRQTFLLERKYDRRAGRMVPVREYRFADRHLDFLAHRLDDRSGDHTPTECAYGADLYSGRSIMGREAFKACNDLYSDSEDPL